jgi:hypothetical protein
LKHHDIALIANRNETIPNDFSPMQIRIFTSRSCPMNMALIQQVRFTRCNIRLLEMAVSRFENHTPSDEKLIDCVGKSQRFTDPFPFIHLS